MISKEITVAITGSTGHLASAIIPLLIGQGYRLHALVHKREPAVDLSTLDIVEGSLSDIDSLNRLVKDCRIVIHCAAKISLNSNRDPSVYETNVNGTMNLFNASKQARVKRFIHLSSIHAYDQLTAAGLLNEESPYCPDHAPRYDQSKRDAQKFVLQQLSDQMEVVVLNPTAVVGPFDHKLSLMGKAIKDIYNGKVPVLISGGFDFCDVRDVAAGVVAAMDKGRNGQSYLLSGRWHSLVDLQRIIMDIKGDRRNIPVLPAWTAYLGSPFILMLAAFRGKEPLYTRESILAMTQGHKNISSAKAEKELGYACRPLRETISDSIDWFKQTGSL
ncbi:MAG: NAD-dependent epimerase/dehydratase family protein [Bacteroidales bacterium]|jgi:dihydroflavonol-4-reductase